MDYMRQLNTWLEQEVHERRQRLDDIVTLVDRLGEDVRNIQVEGWYLNSYLRHFVLKLP